MSANLDTSQIKEWRSIITFIVFLIANIVILFPFNLAIYVPRRLVNLILRSLAALRVIAPRQNRCNCTNHEEVGKFKHAFMRLNFPMNFVTAPLIAVLFLLAISAIRRKEVHDGTLGVNSVSPIDIIAFCITLAYITISIDASGIIRYLAWDILRLGRVVGHRLFFYFYAFFLGLGTVIGNDFVIRSCTSFLANFTRIATNIVHPRAWVHTQLAVAKMSSAILVSSNPANLILASAFNIKFVHYTANMIIPVAGTVTVLFPFLLYGIFADEAFIPLSVKLPEISEEAMASAKKHININIPHARGVGGGDDEQDINPDLMNFPLKEIANRFLDKGGAASGIIICIATLVTLLALNAATASTREHPVYWVTLPAAFTLFCIDVASGWHRRYETRMISRHGRLEIDQARAERALEEQQEEARRRAAEEGDPDAGAVPSSNTSIIEPDDSDNIVHSLTRSTDEIEDEIQEMIGDEEKQEMERREQISREMALWPARHSTFVSVMIKLYEWCHETFPTATTVITHLPFAFVPFAFCIFVLVQAMVARGWVAVFAYGWGHWVDKTGTVGAVAGMGFLSVILCNFLGTDIGTTILLCRVIQAWQAIHLQNGTPISDRTFWATIYSMALGVNYGGFSVTFSASTAGLLWRDILARKHIRVRRIDFVRVNLPIIVIAMTVGCVILVGEVYIMRDQNPYDS